MPGQESAVSTINRRTFLGAGAAAVAGLSMGSRAWAQSTPQASPVDRAVVDPAALEDLRSRLTGTLMLPGDSGYEPASAPSNGRYLETRPAAVARCADEQDVATCVAWCLENGVAPVPRGGGHSYAGYSTTTGLLIDIRRLNSFQVDRNAGTAVVGGAALNNDAMTAFENGPVFIPGGTCLGVGYGGLTLGGGIGYNTHWAGLTCDHLTGSRIVTADAQILDVDASSHADLFWACRGGAGGTFGINTAFRFNVVEVPQHQVGWYRFDWEGADDAMAVHAAFDRLIQTAPAALNCVCMSEPTEVGSGGPRAAVHTMSRGQYIGPVEELRELVQPLLDAATPAREVLQPMAFWDIQRMIATGEPEPHSWGDVSRYAGAPLSDDIVAALVEAVVDSPYRTDDANGSVWSLAWVGGDVVNAVPRDATAYVHRGVTTLLRPTTVWPNGEDGIGDELNAWTDSVIETLRPVTLDESYQNFPNRSIENWEQLYFAENYERLVDVKTQYDPTNLFSNPQSVQPRT
jgi:FAD/FMN-containing dehydrogenase